MLVVGLGNPGAKYKNTRHNLGFAVVERIALEQGLKWEDKEKFQALVAEGEVKGKLLTLLMPTTYMNLSGLAVASFVKAKGMRLDDLLVISDDVSLPLGTIRMRPQGSSGGHNGLKSIEEELHTQYYVRLRLGVGAPLEEELDAFVLGRFKEEEKTVVTGMIDKAKEMVELWLQEGVAATMQKVNQKKET